MSSSSTHKPKLETKRAKPETGKKHPKAKVNKMATVLSLLPRPGYQGKKLSKPTYVQEATVPLSDEKDDERATLFKQVSAEMQIKVQVGVVSIAGWQTATTDVRSFLWDPSTNAQFLLLAGLFSQYTVDSYEVAFMTDMPPVAVNLSLSSYAPQTFVVCDDPGLQMSSITETEMMSMPGLQLRNLSRQTTPLMHRVKRKDLLLAMAQANYLQPGGWILTGYPWQGQTVTFARTPTGSGTPGTEQYLRGYVRWILRFRNHFDV